MSTPAEATKTAPPVKDSEPDLATEIKVFEDQCQKRYTFNNGWDVVLTVGGILLGVGVSAAGVFTMGKTGAILGAIVTAVVSAQRAFPFSQRAQFYRSLIGQASNLRTDLAYNLISQSAAATAIKSLRLDYAQQLPRGSGSTTDTAHPANESETTNNQNSSSKGNTTE